MLFEDFDFSILTSPDFKEDSVREELVTPLLHELGYKSSGDFRIIRGKPLAHPFVNIGSKKRKVNIVPDYLLRIKNRYSLVLDAKSPTERNIFTGEHVDQAYSYAIHPDVRTPMYALCNGYDLVVFHVKQRQSEPILEISLQEIPRKWQEVNALLSPYTILKYDPKPVNLYPDYGSYFNEFYGENKKVIQFFYEIPIDHIARINDLPTFSTCGNLCIDGSEYCITLDFGLEQLNQILELMSERQKIEVINSISQQPYSADILPPVHVTVGAVLGESTKTKYEEIIPFNVFSFEQ